LLSYIATLSCREKDGKLLYYRLSALGLGLALSCFYLIPAIAEQQFVNIAALTKTTKFWLENNFLFSRSGGDSTFNRTISFVALSTAFIPAVSLILAGRRRGKSYGNLPSYDPFFAVAGFISFLLMLPVSRILWSVLPVFKQVQFPWRLLSITTFFASICVGIILTRISNSAISSGRRTRVLIGYLLVTSLAVNGWHSYTVIRSAPILPIEHVRALKGKKVSFLLSDDSAYGELERKYSLFSNGSGLWLMDVREYRPRWSFQPIITDHIPPISEDEKSKVVEGYRALIKKRLSESPHYDFVNDASIYYDKDGSYVLLPPMKLLQSVDATDIAIRIPYEMLKELVFFKKGSGKASVTRWDAEDRAIHVEAAEPSDLLIKTFYYPRWKAYREGVLLPTSADPDTGLIAIQIPSGSYTIDVRFEASVYRIVGIVIAVCSMAILLLLLLIWLLTILSVRSSP
jgi:hypothetical protein